MRASARLITLLFAVFAFGQIAAQPLPVATSGTLVVRQVSSPRPISFPYRWRGVFKASHVEGAIRLRIFRGAKADILRDAKENAYPHGCVRMQSLVVEPSVANDRISLPFYFDDGWLTPINNRIQDGAFTIVFEVPEEGWHLNNPGGSIQPVDIQTEALDSYFGSGLNVAVVAPVYRLRRRPAEVSPSEALLASAATHQIQTAVSISQAGSATAGQAPPPPISSMAVSCNGIRVAPPPYTFVLNGGPFPDVRVASLK
jgi:hypothetical protein